LDRDGPYFQSRGRWRVQHVRRNATRYYHHHQDRGGEREDDDDGDREGLPATRTALSKQFWDEWFHVLAYQRTGTLLLILVTVYAAIVANFAAVYYVLSTYGQEQKINEDGSISMLPFCDMDINTRMEALYFSLSTMTTIGYGVSDYYFGGCWSPLLLVLMEVCCGICFDAVATSLLFLRVSRGHKRGKTVLFSSRAVVRRVRGVPVLMFRVAELRRHQLHGATIQAYMVRHERHVVHSPLAVSSSNGPALLAIRETEPLTNDLLETPSPTPAPSRSVETVHYVTRRMSLSTGSDPSDAPLSLLMSLPQVLVHRLDSASPLLPPSPLWYDVHGHAHTASPSGDGGPAQYSLQEIEKFLIDREAEIVVILEGTDELTGVASQSRHSYAACDICWNHAFVPCVHPCLDEEEEDDDYDQQVNNHWRWLRLFFPRPPGREQQRTRSRRSSRVLLRSNPVCVVDFARFHDTAPAPDDCENCPYVIE
jgi:hypothetical protein